MLEQILKSMAHADVWQQRRPIALQALMNDTHRELAVFASDMVGAQAPANQLGRISWWRRADRRLVRDIIDNSPIPVMLIDPRPGLHIVDRNEAYARATMTERQHIGGEKLFDAFPDNTELTAADGVSNLYDSLKQAVQTGQPHVMAPQRYDILDGDGHFIERHWLCANTPIFDNDGRLLFLLHSARELHPGSGDVERV